jgi:hypothetical protein
MAPRNLSSNKFVVPSKLRLRLGGINSSVDASLRHGAYQLENVLKDQTAWGIIHTGPVDANSHQVTLRVLDSPMEATEHGIAWY